jgi:hypothetical protein
MLHCSEANYTVSPFVGSFGSYLDPNDPLVLNRLDRSTIQAILRSVDPWLVGPTFTDSGLRHRVVSLQAYGRGLGGQVVTWCPLFKDLVPKIQVSVFPFLSVILFSHDV